MNSSPSKTSLPSRSVGLACVCLAAALLAACGQNQPAEAPETNDQTGTPAQTGAQQKQPQEVAVTLKDFAIEMPNTLKPGVYRFEVENRGRQAHNFHISGPNVNEQFDENLNPGEREEMTVTLQPGFYQIICPIPQHADKGMKLSLVVQ